MAHSNRIRTFSTRLKGFLLGERFRIVRSGYRYRIIDRFGRTIAHAKGPHGISLAYQELNRSVPTVQVEEWQAKIQYMNTVCEDAKRRFAEGRC